MSWPVFIFRVYSLIYFTVPFKEAKLVVPTEPLPWPKDRAELVGVNSFGVGGSNAHVRHEHLYRYWLWVLTYLGSSWLC